MTTTSASKPEAKRRKRAFGRLVDNAILEDYSLRYAPSTYRRWSEYTVATAALGGIAYLADFAIGGSISLSFGFSSALVGILLAAVVIFLTSFPITYHSAKYSIDMDLLTRGAGFGYLGSTITSLIYAFTFIFFALEGSIMAQAFSRGFGLPLGTLPADDYADLLPLYVEGALSRLETCTSPRATTRSPSAVRLRCRGTSTSASH